MNLETEMRILQGQHKKDQQTNKTKKKVEYLYLLKKFGGWNSASHADFPINASLVTLRPKMKDSKIIFPFFLFYLGTSFVFSCS